MPFLHVPSVTSLLTIRKSPLHALTRVAPCPSSVSFDLSVVPVVGAFSLWTLSAINTSVDLPYDAVCHWQVSCDIDFFLVFNHEIVSTDFAPVEISGTCATTITYRVSLIVRNADGGFCGSAVQTFDATPFALPSTLTAAGYPCTKTFDDGNQQEWTGDGGAPVSVHMDHTLHTGSGNFDGVGREADAALVTTNYTNKVPHDTAPYGIYTAIGGGTLTVTP